MYDIIHFIKSSTCFSSHRKLFPDFLHVEVALVACWWSVLNYLIFFCACVVETKLFGSAGKMHSYEKIFPRLTGSRSAVGEILVRQGNFQLIWIELFCCWKLGGIIFLIWTAPYINKCISFISFCVFKKCTIHHRSRRTDMFCAKAVIKSL